MQRAVQVALWPLNTDFYRFASMSETWAAPDAVPVNRVVASSLNIMEWTSDLPPDRYFFGLVEVSFHRMILH